MSDDDWRDLEGTWDRLRWARMRWQRQANAVAATAAHAAQSLCMEPGTYRAYERRPGLSKHTPLDHQVAIRAARRFNVSWMWLLTGDGTPFDDVLTPAQERTLRAMQEMDDARQAEFAAMAEAAVRARKAGG
jgi:hypothetical protein